MLLTLVLCHFCQDFCTYYISLTCTVRVLCPPCVTPCFGRNLSPSSLLIDGHCFRMLVFDFTLPTLSFPLSDMRIHLGWDGNSITPVVHGPEILALLACSYSSIPCQACHLFSSISAFLLRSEVSIMVWYWFDRKRVRSATQRTCGMSTAIICAKGHTDQQVS